MDALIQLIQQKIHLDARLTQEIERNFKREEFKLGECLLRAGQYCKKLYFLESGTVHTFYFHHDKEVTSWFYKSGLFFSSWYSFYSQEAGYESIEALEDTVVYSITYENYHNLIKKFTPFERFGRLLAEEQITFVDQFYKGFSFLSAREKYELLLQYFPDIELRVKLTYIASFLGISRETLSRIRANN